MKVIPKDDDTCLTDETEIGKLENMCRFLVEIKAAFATNVKLNYLIY